MLKIRDFLFIVYLYLRYSHMKKVKYDGLTQNMIWSVYVGLCVVFLPLWPDIYSLFLYIIY
jgi:hypothetical protein